MINLTNNMSSLSRGRYTDKYLKDLYETNYKGLTTSQQNKIKLFADTKILENNGQNMTSREKLLKFHDWIIDNFYYYAHPNRIYALNSTARNYNNPFYLLAYEYDVNGKIRARSNGFASMFVALARSQGIPARTVGTYYYKNKDKNYINKGTNITSADVNHILAQVYTNGKWITVDPTADCHQEYLDKTNEYITSPSNLTENYKHKYFDPNIETLSKTHIMLKYYPGSKNIKYITSTYERTKITSFLNKTYNKKTNGKRINSYYNSLYSSTWFAKGTYSAGDGFGKMQKIYWPSNKGLYGSLDLSGFGSLQKLSVYNNKITSLNLSNCPSINTVLVPNNKMTKIIVTGSKNLTLLSAKGNPATYIKYNYGTTKRTAIIKSTTGGTVSVRYTKTSSGKHIHEMKAVAKSGYIFKGWYIGSKRVSKYSSIAPYRTKSFTYTAKFVKKPANTYILVSIKNQKLWYYKNGKLKMSTSIVSGHKGKYDTPKGQYKILGKSKNVYLIGPNYKSWVNYWMLIDRKNQIGLHDATWRGSFGGAIYKYNGSHGCINLPYSKARYLYNYASVGTKVIIK